MKAVILAGGIGSRLSEETLLRPKPMIEIGGKPILWHIMKIYAAHGINHFIVCLGFKGYMVKEYFANYFLHMSDVTIDLAQNTTEIHQNSAEPWRVTLVDTGEHTMTGGRLKRVRKYLGEDDFCLTYGDGVGDVNIRELIDFHCARRTLVTVSAMQAPGRFGSLILNDGKVTSFQEKPVGDSGWINGGFFVVSPKALDHVQGDDTVWEREPLERLAAEGQISAYCHKGFWQPMDTLRDKNQLEHLWSSGRAPWKIW